MPDNVAKIMSAGFDRAYILLTDEQGRAAGLAGSLANGSDAGCVMIDGVKTANLNMPTATRVPITGRNRLLGQFQFPPNQGASFDLEGAIADFDTAAAVEGVKVRDIGKWSLHPIGGKEVSYKDAFLLLEMNAYSKDEGSDGVSVVYSLLMKCQLAYIGPGSINEQGAMTYRFSVTVNNWGKYPWGESMDVTDEGVTSAAMVEIVSDHWLLIHTFVGDNTATSFTVDETPAGDHTTECSQWWKDGVLTTPTTDWACVPATKTYTPTVKPAASEWWIGLYETVA